MSIEAALINRLVLEVEDRVKMESERAKMLAQEFSNDLTIRNLNIHNEAQHSELCAKRDDLGAIANRLRVVSGSAELNLREANKIEHERQALSRKLGDLKRAATRFLEMTTVMTTAMRRALRKELQAEIEAAQEMEDRDIPF